MPDTTAPHADRHDTVPTDPHGATARTAPRGPHEATEPGTGIGPGRWLPGVLRLAHVTGPTKLDAYELLERVTLPDPIPPDPSDATCGTWSDLLADQPARIRIDDVRNDARPSVIVDRACPHVEGRWHPDLHARMHLAQIATPAQYAFACAMPEDCGCVQSAELDLLMRDRPTPPAPARYVRVTTLFSTYEIDTRGFARRVQGVRAPTGAFVTDGLWQRFQYIGFPNLGEDWLVGDELGITGASSPVTAVELADIHPADGP